MFTVIHWLSSISSILGNGGHVHVKSKNHLLGSILRWWQDLKRTMSEVIGPSNDACPPQNFLLHPRHSTTTTRRPLPAISFCPPSTSLSFLISKYHTCWSVWVSFWLHQGFTGVLGLTRPGLIHCSVCRVECSDCVGVPP